MKPCARWTADCQGKWDYDGPLVSISCRYWPGPEGGGSMTFDTVTGRFGTLPYGPRPSARAAIMLDHGPPDEHGDGERTPWREAAFEAPTEAEVKAMVESWVQERFDEVRALLLGRAPETKT